MREINLKPMIHWQIMRIKKAKNVRRVLVATSTEPSDDVLADYLEDNSIDYFRGSLDDVFDRYLKVISNKPDYETIVRLTGDCPLIIPSMLDEMLDLFQVSDFDYYSNCEMRTFPDGLDIEIFSRKAFLRINPENLDMTEKEHVTSRFRLPSENFNRGEYRSEVDYSHLRITVDHEVDFNLIEAIFKAFKGKEVDISFDDIIFVMQNTRAMELSSGAANQSLGTDIPKFGNHNE